MSQIEKVTIRIDQSSEVKGPHEGQALDREALDAVRFKYEFALTCAAEARKFPVGSPEHKENITIAREFLEGALEANPTNSQFHFSRGIVCAEMGDLTAAISSIRNAVMYDPENAPTYMAILQHASEELATISPKAISPLSLKIQSYMVEGNYEAAFKLAHSDINGSIAGEREPNLWNVQLMRVAAMQTQAERSYVETLTLLEQRGYLDAQEIEYLPVGFALTDQMRQAMREEGLESGERPTRSRIWRELEVHEVAPINRTAVRVAPKATETV
jgi:tetratricopeptide (TPR) repeat protein